MTAAPVTMPAQSSTVSFHELCSKAFWQAQFPKMTMEAKPKQAFTKPHQALSRLGARMMKEGYFGESDNTIARHAPVIAAAIERCIGMGLPPVFVFLFDEPWECYHRLKPVLTALLGEDYKLLPDFWAWHVDPTKAQSGWNPHRDKGYWSLDKNGAPLSLTVWMPLSDANPMNSCIYIVPAHMDPTYGTPRDKEHSAPMHAIRALPAKPGDYLCWNQAVLHWGSPSSEFATAPRMSMALEFQRGGIGEFNSPLLPHEPYPDFAFRLQLIAKQILQYQHMYGFSQELRELASYILNNAGNIR